jgi:glycolate oxidase FAD binding subunit
MDLTGFAEAIGTVGPVTIAGASTRGGAVDGVRCVTAPSGIERIDAAEMVVICGAGTLVDDLDRALAEVGQRVTLPAGGTVGGALSVGRSGVARLGDGPVRDAVLQLRYVSADGAVVKAGGPTVKNVSGFDLCRLLVGSLGTLGFLGEVILRTRPRPAVERWCTTTEDPFDLVTRLHRPASVLWDGERTWVLLRGAPVDVDAESARLHLEPADPPELPVGGRWSVPPAELAAVARTGRFVAEIGVGVVHHERPAPGRTAPDTIVRLTERVKREFDPTGRLQPGRSVLDVA